VSSERPEKLGPSLDAEIDSNGRRVSSTTLDQDISNIPISDGSHSACAAAKTRRKLRLGTKKILAPLSLFLVSI